MRDRLNNDPKVQMAAVGILLLAAAFFFISTMGGHKQPEAAPAPTDPAAATTGAIDPATGAPVAATASSSGIPQVPAPPLPKSVQAAYDRNETIALLIIQPGATDDKMVADSLRRLDENGVATFVVDVKDIAKYTAITQGVNVDRTPALVIVRPKKLTGGTPTATVSYSFQSQEAVDQAVRDARYVGPDTTYAPR